MAKVDQIFPSLSVALQAIGMDLAMKDVAKCSVESGKSKILVANWRKIPDLAYQLESTAEDFEINRLDWGSCFNCGSYIKLNRDLAGPGEGQRAFLYFGENCYVCKHCVESNPVRYFTSSMFEKAYVNNDLNWIPSWAHPFVCREHFLTYRIVAKRKTHYAELHNTLCEARKNSFTKDLVIMLEYKSPSNARFSIWRKDDTDTLPL